MTPEVVVPPAAKTPRKTKATQPAVTEAAPAQITHFAPTEAASLETPFWEILACFAMNPAFAHVDAQDVVAKAHAWVLAGQKALGA